VEQGLVTTLEVVAAGYQIFGSNPVIKITQSNAQNEETQNTSGDVILFPESHIRNKATQLLQIITHKLETHSSLRIKLLTSMSVSGNVKLRLNVFSGLFSVAGRGETLGR
jgi:hypothetical protein